MAKQNKFGTFGGVFVPSILTILGVIMYLRLPMIIGEAGLWATIGIIVIAHIISVTTGLSVSAIATDKKVEAGGTYYMISRSLGLPIGGTLGIALFVGLSFSVSLYLIGFSESFLNYWGFDSNINNIRLTGTLVLVAVTTVTFISTSLAIKTQYFIMAAIVLSLLSIFFGSHNFTPEAPLFSNPSSTVPVMVLFGIFFPAVTGFEAGVSMSGDLKNAKKSIPSGSIMAIVVGFLVYIGLAFFFAYTVSGDKLANDPQVLLNISWIPELVIAGIWGATLSSALGSILGAPRILQATAVDRITPRLFSKGYGPTNEPRNALLLTFVIAEAGILIGELDVIARVVSIFFITTYGFLNISATFERWTSADFRPEFKVPGWISILGAAACILVMIKLDFVAMLVAIMVLGLLFLYLKRRELTLESGDAWSGVWASLVKTGITNLKRDKLHKRNWRPNTIMFSGSPDMREYMVEVGKAISGKLGILSAFELVKSEERLLAKTESNLHEEKESAGYFQHKLYCRDIYDGMDQISRVYGFSGIEPNTILMGWSKKPKNREKFIELAESFDQNNYNSIFLNYDSEKKFGEHQHIDIWWSGAGRNLTLAINLLRHINNSSIWNRAKVRVLVINPINEEAESVYKSTLAILNDFRVEAEVRVVNNGVNPISEREIIETESKDADLCIIGIPNQRFRQMDKYYDQLNGILEVTGTALIINASDDFAEMEVIAPAKAKSKIEGLEEANYVLPDLEDSPHPEVVKEIQKIDYHGQKLVKALHRKLFQPIISDRLILIKELESRIGAIKKELADIESIPDTYRRKKQIDKLKNEVFFKVNALLDEQIKKSTLPAETTALTDVTDWYEERLVNDHKHMPADLIVEYSKEEFAIQPDDSASLRFYKRLKLIKHWFSGPPVKHHVNFRAVAKYYQVNSRIVYFNRLLNQFGDDEKSFYHDLRKTIGSLINTIDLAEQKIWQQLPDWNDETKINEIADLLSGESVRQKGLLNIYEGRLLIEFRKNLQLMSNDLGKIDINSRIKKKSRPAKYYQEISLNTKDFSEERHLRIKTLLNMILMELSVNSTKNRLEELQVRFGNDVRDIVESKYVKNLDELITSIDKHKKETDLQKVRLNDHFEVELQETFRDNMTRMIGLTEHMPEAMEVYSFNQNSQGDQETLAIPVARMAEYYLKSQYEVVVEEQFGKLIEALKRSMYSVKDLINLAEFNLENTDSEIEDKELLEDLVTKIEKEKTSVNESIQDYLTFTQKQFAEAFDPLSSLKIEESANTFVAGLRNYQGKKVLTGISHVSDWFKKKVLDITIKLFYSRSEGILIAKKLNRAKDLTSPNSKMLDLKEKVSPTADILHSLPSYYVTLFNGKSNIGRDFWIPRTIEEKAFATALKRYREGFGGGILLVGDRNSGKTAFCRHVTQPLKSGSVYTLFPPVQGDTSALAFSQALSKATQMNGDVNQILSAIPQDSILVIDDLELFWERHSDGLALIHLLQQLIDDYGQRILFIVNINPHAFRVINQLTRLSDRFIEIINFVPFDAEDLKELIMKRHRSSGLGVGFNAQEKTLSEVQLARLFDAYFNYSEGSPGTALNGWLAHIKKHHAHSLIIDKPDAPSTTCIKELNEDWVMLLTQFILHKRLTEAKMARVSGWTAPEVKSQLLAMLRAGIVQEKASGIYHINPFMHPFVIRALKEREVIR
ncbi:amino acid permease [Fulvivirga sp. 29W222]|uniref:Amino acid permease n=1 Tax=Fulvivirga marina TaxID=2494733 RepID=A0A937G0Y5_9BACT|nr:amino acid permease [Fulvivirga marina]MBL6448527.1 amino acid permease [Fulvivirga marina]